MSCDLVNGRLLDECLLGRSGIKTLYFTKFNDFDSLTGVVEVGGEITDLGTDLITIYQFDMQKNVGNFEEIPESTPENGTIFLTQNVTLTLFFVKPDDLENLNNLKRGRWTIWALDFQGKIRLFGRTRGMVASGGSDVSGAAPGDKKGLDLILTSFEQDYAPFMADFTTVPFDNFTNVTVVAGTDYGAELNTNANATSPTNEANATTGFSQVGLDIGANVFQSQGGVVSEGSFAIEANCDDTPTAQSRFFVDLEAAPFNLINGNQVKLEIDSRHIGTGGALGNWRIILSSSTSGTNHILKTLVKTDLTFDTTVLEYTHDATYKYLVVIEANSEDDGGVYVDNLSVKIK